MILYVKQENGRYKTAGEDDVIAYGEKIAKERLSDLVINGVTSAVRHLRLTMGILKQEQVRVLFLNSIKRVIAEEIHSTGTENQSAVFPRKIFQSALSHGAVAVILAHNHPTGRCQPSEADKKITELVKKGGELLGIELLDSLIISSYEHYSFAEQREL